MLQNELITKRDVQSIGEEIGYELGAQLVQDYQTAHPTDVQSFIIGRNIIDQILAQPGCAGIQIYNAYNEAGEKTLVYIGLDQEGKSILEFTTVNTSGILEAQKGIVADKVRSGGPYPKTNRDDESFDDGSWWSND
ncbi:MAG: hypothetical protein P0Y53_25425 [Candidatus Pseudobacter hemicellulosilyticus]|uniref:Uncharacterized protein n=1 Tax=Candidatus Pseudobacter hemicellulosilyticus TaxID=3121375 RepID=A0AAJ6BI31_9BACT|nr:MAG: hypothetical protein P0Y53_25425 [Pseudobacter sp.]